MLFNETPDTWGLRDDPHLWDELAEVAKTLMLPRSGNELTKLIRLLIRNLIGEDLAPGKWIAAPRYRFGGMSSGAVSADFWLEKAVPLLEKRLAEARD